MLLAHDARILNMLANHPDIFPFVTPQGTEWKPENYVLLGALYEGHNPESVRFLHDGESDADMNASLGMLFTWSSPRAWELHMFAKPEARGGQAMRFATAAIQEMFDTEADRIWGQTPIWNERARVMHAKVGGISKGFRWSNIMQCECEVFETTRDEWEARVDKYVTTKDEVS